jgi:hypothetical protein
MYRVLYGEYGEYFYDTYEEAKNSIFGKSRRSTILKCSQEDKDRYWGTIKDVCGSKWIK